MSVQTSHGSFSTSHGHAHSVRYNTRALFTVHIVGQLNGLAGRTMPVPRNKICAT